MKRMIVPACLALVGLIAPRLAAAQDVAITNARVIVGSGQVIESGTIIVRGGKIVSVSRRRGAHAGAAHHRRQGHERHAGVHRRPQARQQRRERGGADASLLEAGYTTVLAGGGQADANIALRDRIDKGEFIGPRIIASGQVESPADAGRSACGGPGAGRQGDQAHRGNRTDAGAGAAAGGDRSAQGDRRRGQEGRRAGQRARGEQPGDGRGDRRRRDPPGAPPEQGLHQLRAGREGGAGRGDRRRPDRVRRAEHRPPVAGARAGAVAEGQHRALPRRQAVARSDRRREPRPEGPRDRHRRRLHDHQRPPHLGRRPEPPDDSRIPPIRTPPTSWCSSTS